MKYLIVISLFFSCVSTHAQTVDTTDVILQSALDTVYFRGDSLFGKKGGIEFFQTKTPAPAYVEKTANYTATISDYTINCTSGSFTVTLPTAIGRTRIFIVKNSGAGTITMASTLGQTFDGASSPTISAGAVTWWQSTNTAWTKIN